MNIWDIIGKEFFKINYSTLLIQFKDKGLSEIDCVNYMLHIYELTYQSLIAKDSDKIDDEEKHNADLLFYRIEIENLREKKNNLGYQLKVENQLKNIEVESESDGHISAVKKMIYLHELGVFEYLQSRFEAGNSTNTIAEVITKITGENKTTIQPLINIILTDIEISNSKNPYSTEKNVKTIRNYLKAKGFKLRD